MARPARSPRPTCHRSSRLELRHDRPLRVVIVSDTHSEPHPKSLALVEKESPDAILHAGDIGALEVLEALDAIAPVTAVRGNIDTRAAGLADSFDIALCDGDQVRLRVLLIHMAVYGPKLRADAGQLARAHSAQLVVFGHSHVPFIGRDRGVTLFNPGSIGPRRPPLPITYGVMEVSATAVSLRHMSCETGERWRP